MPDEDNLPAITVDDIDTAPESSVVTQEDTPVSVDDIRNAFVRLGEENSLLKQELDATKKRVRTIEILDDLIEPMAKRAFWFMCAYCAVVASILILHGFALSEFALPETVLTFLVGSTATTVIGLVGMVLTGIFVGARNGSKS